MPIFQAHSLCQNLCFPVGPNADERIVSVTRLAEVTEQNGNGAAEAPEGAPADAEEGDGPADE